jgi:hypothetical protein
MATLDMLHSPPRLRWPGRGRPPRDPGSAGPGCARGGGTTGAGPAATFTIANRSHLHLTGDTHAPRSEALPFGATRGMNCSFRALLLAPALLRADLVPATGDVSDRGAPAACDAFRSELSSVGSV